MIPAAFGVIIFYIIKTASEYETALTTKSVNDSMQQISYIVESLFNNKEMILFVIAMVVTITAVYAVRRLKIDNAWTYAIAAGIVVVNWIYKNVMLVFFGIDLLPLWS